MMISGVFLGETATPGTVLKKSRKNDVTTLVTKTSHHLSVGDKVVVSDVGSDMDGTWTVSAVSSTTKFSFKQKKADVVEKKVSGSYAKSVGITVDISELITGMSVSLSMNEVSQVTMTVSDPGLRYMDANYFQLRQKIKVAGEYFEIASLEVRQGQAGEEIVMECRLEGVQKLKRDKGKAVYSGGSATSFAAEKARTVGLSFFGENSTAKSSISRVRNDKADESSWDVMKRLAGDNQFLLFETDGRVFFCSQHFLLGKYSLAPSSSSPGFLTTIVKWDTSYTVTANETASTRTTTRYAAKINGPVGRPTLKKGATGDHVKYVQNVIKNRIGPATLPVDGKFSTTLYNAVIRLQKYYGLTANGIIGQQTWSYVDKLAEGSSTTGNDQGYFDSYVIVPMETPSLRMSDDAYSEVTAQFRVDKEVGKLLRPGMTISVRGVPGFTTNYLINEVSWEEGTPDPVSVSASTPQIPTDKKSRDKALAKIDLTGGGFKNLTADGVIS
jgi:peptidoglycan hydrolase-like protein with peptidoglycan-binding domain